MRSLWYALGLIALALGIVGIALPVVPTVPFLLLAAGAFARSSPRLERRIMNHPTYGPPVRAWRERGAISRLAKTWAVLRKGNWQNGVRGTLDSSFKCTT